MTTCLDAVDTRIGTLGYMDGVDEEALHLDYMLFQDQEIAAAVKPMIKGKSKAERAQAREVRFNERQRAEALQEKRATMEALQSPESLLAETEATIESLKDRRLVANAKLLRFSRGDSMSGSTGLSREYRAAVERQARLKGEPRKPRGPKPGAFATGETRDRSIANARLNSNHLIKVLIDHALDKKLPLRMQTVTFPDTMPLELVVEAVKRIRDIFDRIKNKHYVIVYGVGDKKKKDYVDGMVTRSRLHLHIHCFNICKKASKFENIVLKVLKEDKRFRKYKPKGFSPVNNQVIDPRASKTKGYHAAWYGANNLKTFTSGRMAELIEEGVYDQDAMAELDLVRSKTTFQLYMAGRETNALLKDRTAEQEIHVERTGLDAANQAALHFHKVTKHHIEKTNFCVSRDGSKFYINYDATTEKSFRGVLAKRCVPVNGFHAAFLRAWTLHKEAGYQPSRAFMNFVMQNPEVHIELERCRTQRKFYDVSPSDFLDSVDVS